MKIESSTPDDLNGKGLKIAIVLSRFNDSAGNELLKNTVKELQNLGVEENDIILERVPGALELPFAAQEIARQKPDVMIALGVVIRGETYHFELVANESHRGLMNVSLTTGIPVIFGVITANTPDQAIARASKTQLNKGKEYAQSAIEMARLAKKLREPQKKVE